ncbi:MAG: hypothetical protein CVV27_11095 [Candidatus Melainabacteria bacterium HGW-Melainabacteria-1]|nr:MAG: hypothetical protein CVV27_11095 [Candidatus Melainabacteria bacterium HGW-Melainabacteria-1]
MCLLAGTGCKGEDPVNKDLEQYVQQDLHNIRTYLRAAQDQYKSSMNKDDFAKSQHIRKKVIPQYDKYLTSLKKVETKTGFVDNLHDGGLQAVTDTINSLSEYSKVMLKRDSHLTMRSRQSAEEAMDKLDQWQSEVREEARSRGIKLPSEYVR